MFVGLHYTARGGLSGGAALLLAVDPDREHYGGDPDGHDEDVDQDREHAADTNGPEERLHVGDEDEAADGAAEDAGWHDAHYVGGYRGGNDATEEQGAYDGPRDLGEAKGEEEADARAEGHEELAGIDGADDLTRFHTPGGEQRRRGDGAPSATAGGVEEAGDQTEGSEKASRNGPDLDGTLMTSEGEPGEHEDAEREQEDGDDGLGRLGGYESAQHHGAKEGSYRARYRERPDLRPVHVSKPPVGGA